MKNIKKYIGIGLISLGVLGCDDADSLIQERLESNPDITEIPVTGGAGSLDLSVTVSLGASISAGFADGALYTDAQNKSFLALLAQQFQTEGAGGGVYNQPDINSVNGFSGISEDNSIEGRLILDLDANNDGESGDASIVASEGDVPGAFEGDKTMLNNFSVPGIQTAQMLTALTGGPDDQANPAFNSLYARFASEPGVSTILGDALARNPTFFTLWAGGNDVLGYAVSGGTNDAILTNPGDVGAAIGALLDALLAVADEGIIFNVPNVAVLPHFQAVPRTVEVPEASRVELQAGIDQINTAITGWNALAPAEAQRPLLSTDFDNYPLLIVDESLSDAEVPTEAGPFVIPKVRNIIATPIVALGGLTELILLPALPGVSTGAKGFSPLAPLTDGEVLDATELGTMLPNLIAINTAIATEAATREGLMLYDVSTLLTNIAVGGGYTSEDLGDITLAPDFSPNGVFSNDGIHLNPRGAAVLANEVINSMNQSVENGGFGTDIPSLDILSLRSSPFQF